MEQKMFCYQCQETAGCKGCTMSGVCGKKPDVAAMQDLLVYVTKGISAITTALRQEGKQVSAKINHLITLNLFTTITNANFDKESIESRIRATLTEKEVLLKQVTNLTVLPEAAKWNGSENWEEKARTVGVLSTENEDIRSLRELITYGLKGLSAYSKHANVLLKDNDEVDAFLQKALAATLNDNLSVEDLIALTMEKASKLISRSEAFCNWNIRSHSCASFLVAKPRLHFCLRSPFQFTYLAITYHVPLSSFLNTGIIFPPFLLRRAFHRNTGGSHAPQS